MTTGTVTSKSSHHPSFCLILPLSFPPLLLPGRPHLLRKFGKRYFSASVYSTIDLLLYLSSSKKKKNIYSKGFCTNIQLPFCIVSLSTPISSPSLFYLYKDSSTLSNSGPSFRCTLRLSIYQFQTVTRETPKQVNKRITSDKRIVTLVSEDRNGNLLSTKPLPVSVHPCPFHLFYTDPRFL